jgi:hypothetical protein
LKRNDLEGIDVGQMLMTGKTTLIILLLVRAAAGAGGYLYRQSRAPHDPKRWRRPMAPCHGPACDVNPVPYRT